MNRRNDTLGYVLYAGPDIKAQGGIAAVVQSYDDAFGPITYLPTTSRHGKAASVVRFALSMALLPLYRLRGFRILHAHGAVRGSFPRKRMLLKWASMLGMRTVHHLHSGRVQEFCEKKGVERMRQKFSHTDAIVALSAFWAGYLRNRVGLDNVHIVHNIIKPVAATPEPRPHSPLRLLFVGAIHESKGIFDLLEVFAVHQDLLRGRVCLHIGGSGPGNAQMADIISRSGIGDIVFAHGWVAGEEKDRLFAECDVFILPSYAEGVPVCVLEAMSAKMAVIASTVGGIPEIIKDGKNGLLIPEGDTDAILDAILRIEAKREDINVMGDTNHAETAAYMPEQVKQELLELYKTLLNNASEA